MLKDLLGSDNIRETLIGNNNSEEVVLEKSKMRDLVIERLLNEKDIRKTIMEEGGLVMKSVSKRKPQIKMVYLSHFTEIANLESIMKYGLNPSKIVHHLGGRGWGSQYVDKKGIYYFPGNLSELKQILLTKWTKGMEEIGLSHSIGKPIELMAEIYLIVKVPIDFNDDSGTYQCGNEAGVPDGEEIARWRECIKPEGGEFWMSQVVPPKQIKFLIIRKDHPQEAKDEVKRVAGRIKIIEK